MFRMSTVAGLVLASTLATTAVFFGATGSIASSPVAEASVTTVAAAQPVQVSAAPSTASIAPETAASDGCARKVKVVYAGYGEAMIGCVAKR